MKITFPLLSDPGSKTIEAYNILNKAAKGRRWVCPIQARSSSIKRV